MPAPHRLQRLALVLAVLGAPPSAGEPQGQLRGTAFAGVDTNARREFEGGALDLVGSLLLAAQGRTSLGGLDLGGAYEAAGRKFFLQPSLDTLAQQLELEAASFPLPTLQAGAEGKLKDRRGGLRQYTDLSGSLFLRWRAVAPLDVELRAGAHRFIYWTVFQYSFSALEGSARVRYRFDRRHALTATFFSGPRRYNSTATSGAGDPVPRADAALAVGAGYAYRGPLQLSLEYGYWSQDSNRFGQSLRLHRLDAACGVRLPWEWVALVQAGLWLAEYPEGVDLPEASPLTPDDEPHHSLALKLVRPLSRAWDLELRYGLYLNWLPRNGLSYARQLGSVGVAFRL